MFPGPAQDNKDTFRLRQDRTGGGTLQDFTLLQSLNEVAGEDAAQPPRLVMRGIAPGGPEPPRRRVASGRVCTMG